MHVAEKCVFRKARPADASGLVSSYESVFGVGGVKAPGHEPYPAPEVFTEAGVLQILTDEKREFWVAEVANEIAGAMLVTHNSRYHREFGCVSVRRSHQGTGLSSLMLSLQKSIEKQTLISINTTEIVTHSMLSQSAHHRAGYDKITGFGYCQYPRVFFSDTPESCLWITSLEGKVFDSLRSKCEHRPPDHAENLLVKSLSAPRQCYVPTRYAQITNEILSQFKDTIDYDVVNLKPIAKDFSLREKPLDERHSTSLDLCEDAPYAYLHFSDRFANQSNHKFEELWTSIQRAGKRYVQARIAMNTPAAIDTINFLQERGFLFLGVAPLFAHSDAEQPDFQDIFLMQHLDDETLRHCPLPGETNAVAKLFGYPLNLTGQIIRTIRQDIRDKVGAHCLTV